MGEYVQLGAVKTWYEKHGEGKPLVLMHGGLVEARPDVRRGLARRGGALPGRREEDREMAAKEPDLQATELTAVTARTLVMFADDDLVTLAHSVEIYNNIPNAEFAIVPGTSHFLVQEKPHLVNQLVLDFLTNAPVPTIAPIRRAPASPEPA